ncbi:HAD family hydrolase [bacterium D16-76]|nr:HAD family hydrolase [bacterium D16-76]
MLQAILFDIYGTLLDTGTGSVDACTKILRQNGQPPIAPAGFYARWKQLHRQHMDESPFRTEEAIYHADLRALYQEYHLPGDPAEDVKIMLATLGTRRPYPEAKQALPALQGKAILCAASITDNAPLSQDLSRAGIHFAKTFTSESLRCYKPDPRFYTAILSALGIRPQEALFVGDSLLNDVTGPQAAGIPACWVNRHGRTPGKARPAYTVASLAGLLPLVDALRKGARP